MTANISKSMLAIMELEESMNIWDENYKTKINKLKNEFGTSVNTLWKDYEDIRKY